MNGRRRRAGGLDDRAVSEVLSFVLVFGIILTSVAVLSVTGLQAMADYRTAEQLRNGERAMEAFAGNVDDVVRYGGIEHRHGELALRDGTLVTGDDGTVVTVAFDGTDGSFEETYELGTLAYEYESTRIAYEGGGVVRADDSGSVVRKEPLLTCRGETAVVSLVAVDTVDRSVQHGPRTGVTVRVQDRTSEVYDLDDGGVSITVEETPYDLAWESVVDNWDGCEPDRVQLTVVTVDVED